MKIKIDGVEYEFPASDSLTMDEAIVLERYSGVGLETLAPGESMPLGAVKAFCIIAVMRARPDVTEREIAQTIGRIKLTELSTLVDAEGDAGPPDVTDSGNYDSTRTSGAVSNGASATYQDEGRPRGSGRQESDTGVMSNREVSAS